MICNPRRIALAGFICLAFVASGLPPLRSFGGRAVALAEAGGRTSARAQAPDGYMIDPARVKAFVGARVVDGTDRAPIDNAVIVVREGRIVTVGPLGRVTIPADA